MDSCRDSLKRKLYGRQRQEYDLDPVSGGLPLLQNLKIRPAAQRAFKGKVLSGFDQSGKFGENKSAGLPSCQFRAERRQPTGNQVGIHEMNDADFSKKKFPGERGFSSTIGTSDNNAARVLSCSVVHCADQLATGCW